MQSSLPVLLQYLLNCLIAGESKVLIVLRDLIGRMTGVEPFADLSDAQVMSLAGGPTLRKEVYAQTTQVDLTGKKIPPTKSLADAKKRRSPGAPCSATVPEYGSTSSEPLRPAPSTTGASSSLRSTIVVGTNSGRLCFAASTSCSSGNRFASGLGGG